MVPNGAKVLPERLDGALWASLDSLGFGLAQIDERAQPPERAKVCSRPARKFSVKAEENLSFQ